MARAHIPSATDIRRAALTIEGHAVKTPLLESPHLNKRLGGRILFKAEPLQITGSFKFRGAFNRLSAIPENERDRGVVAYSSGNHAQGVAAAAKILGTHAIIAMPEDAPAIKIANTRAWGAEIVYYDREKDDRELLCRRLVEDRGATLVRPFDDALIIAGQGTVGLETAQQARAVGVTLDCTLVPCGGGGLAAGTALALASEMPDCRVYAVEPVGFDTTGAAIRAGKRLPLAPHPPSICDALMSPEAGELTFAVNADRLAGGIAVGDDAIKAAMRTAFQELKTVVEPGGAAALAAILEGALDVRGKSVGIILSGGNVDPGMFARVLNDI